MSATGIIAAAVLIGGVGIFVGIFLGIAGIFFKVQVNEKEEAVLNALPGNNCGGCGFPGCAGLAAAIAKGEAPVNACPVGGGPVGEEIAKIMGVESKKTVRMAAYVLYMSFLINALFEAYPPFGPGVKCFILWMVYGFALAEATLQTGNNTKDNS